MLIFIVSFVFFCRNARYCELGLAYSSKFRNWLKINKNIKENNYNKDIGFPYVGYLLFKNLWGCDMTNYLETFVNKAYLTHFL